MCYWKENIWNLLNPYLLTVLLSIPFNKLPCSWLRSPNRASAKWPKQPPWPRRLQPLVAIFMSINGSSNWLRNIVGIVVIHLRNWAKLFKKSWQPDVNLWPLIRKGQLILFQVLVLRLSAAAMVSFLSFKPENQAFFFLQVFVVYQFWLNISALNYQRTNS